MIGWSYAFIDRPHDRVTQVCAFWGTVTGTRPSAPRGERGEFASLLPEGDADPHLKVQGVGDGGGAHLDLAVDDLAGTLRAARRLGASVAGRADDLVVLRSPTGQPFCLVPWEGEAIRQPPVVAPGGVRSRLDQVCIDIAPAAYDREVAFWRELTGWEYLTGALPEFSLLRPPPTVPVQILLQRLGTDRPTTAHLDLACADVPATRQWHERCGARTVAPGPWWVVMRDPAGGVYCLTSRDPDTGRLRR